MTFGVKDGQQPASPGPAETEHSGLARQLLLNVSFEGFDGDRLFSLMRFDTVPRDVPPFASSQSNSTIDIVNTLSSNANPLNAAGSRRRGRRSPRG